jgi:hypothetical protein
VTRWTGLKCPFHRNNQAALWVALSYLNRRSRPLRSVPRRGLVAARHVLHPPVHNAVRANLSFLNGERDSMAGLRGQLRPCFVILSAGVEQPIDLRPADDSSNRRASPPPSRIGLGQCCTALNMAWSLWLAQLLEGEKGFIDDRYRMPRRQ